jgi:aspartate racemase
MKKVGIVGGLGPESTRDYYMGIIDAFKESFSTDGFPEIIIESLDLRTIISLIEADKWNEVASIISRRFENLKACGADFGVIATNTPHKMFHQIQAKTSLPLISIVSETCRQIKSCKVKKVLLLGTGFTMTSDFFINELRGNGIDVVVPEPEEIKYIQHKLMTEIEMGIILESTQEKLVSIIQRIETQTGVEGVVLACTELPLILKPGDMDLRCFDTVRIHIDAIVGELRKENR